MSRRKQSNPVKSVTDDSDEETTDFPDIGLPTKILHLNRTLRPPLISSISTILEGSQFGPFACSLTEISGSRSPGNLRLHLGGRELNVYISSASGLWLHLVKTSSNDEETNLQFLLSREKLLCLVTKNISPDVEIVASSRAKLMGTEEESHAVERKMHQQESNCRNHVEVKTEVPEVEREGRSSAVKHESPHELWTLNSRTFSSSTTQQQTHGKNIMIQNLLNRPSKPTYELVHECIFCGVKFSNPRTLQAHLTNYCSKKPQFDLCSSPSNFVFYSILPNHLRYNFGQLRSSLDVPCNTNPGLNFRKNNKTPRNEEVPIEKCKKEEESEVKSEPRVKSDEQINQSKDSQTDSQRPSSEVLKFDKHEADDVFQPFSSFHPPSLNPPPRFPLLNCFPNFPLEFFKKNYLESHPLPPFLNPFLLYPSYFFNPSSSSDPKESSSSPKSKLHVPNTFSKSPNAPNASKGRNTSVDEKSSLKSFPPKADNPLDLSSKKEDATTDSGIPEGIFLKKSRAPESTFSGKSGNSASRSESKQSEPTFPFVMNPPSTNRCVECNIVFFKAENYLAHKQHYCASRNNRLRDIAQQKTSTTKATLKHNETMAVVKGVDNPKINGEDHNSSDVNNNNNIDMELVATLNKGILQYYCIPCKIKFSNLETLKAHKKFYCSSRFNRTSKSPERQTEEAPEASSEESKECDKKTFACSVCGVLFPSEQLLMLHFCNGVAANYQLYQCPHCDHIAQSDSRLIEHMRAHTPSKVYKCILCGYRGNTVRGMRMHGKMHNDAGESFTDESMLEVEEPPAIPKKNKLSSLVGDPALFGSVLDMPDLELIRLKSEPYKRRRSRKAYEKSEYMMRQNEQNFCNKCDISFPLNTQFHMHMLNHVNETRLGSNVNVPNKVSENETVADLEVPSFSMNSTKRSLSSDSFQEGPSSSKLLKLSPRSPKNGDSGFYPKFELKDVARSSEDERAPSPVKNPPSHESDQVNDAKPATRRDNLSKYCKQCNINFMYVSTYLAHKKYYCSNQIEEDADDISVC